MTQQPLNTEHLLGLLALAGLRRLLPSSSMIIWLLAAQHQLLARPACGVNRRVSTRSWHASRAQTAPRPGARARSRHTFPTGCIGSSCGPEAKGLCAASALVKRPAGRSAVRRNPAPLRPSTGRQGSGDGRCRGFGQEQLVVTLRSEAAPISTSLMPSWASPLDEVLGRQVADEDRWGMRSAPRRSRLVCPPPTGMMSMTTARRPVCRVHSIVSVKACRGTRRIGPFLNSNMSSAVGVLARHRRPRGGPDRGRCARPPPGGGQFRSPTARADERRIDAAVARERLHVRQRNEDRATPSGSSGVARRPGHDVCAGEGWNRRSAAVRSVPSERESEPRNPTRSQSADLVHLGPCGVRHRDHPRGARWCRGWRGRPGSRRATAHVRVALMPPTSPTPRASTRRIWAGFPSPSRRGRRAR